MTEVATDKEDVVELLRSVGVLANLRDADLAELAAAAESRFYSFGDAMLIL